MARRFENKTVLITGASSGIGAALAREFAREGANLVLTARRLDRLEQLAQELRDSATSSRILVSACDVTRDGDVEKAVDSALEAFGRVDVVIANAGFGVAGAVQKLKLEDYRRQFETNVFGLQRTCYAAIDALKETRGSLVLLGSVASYIALPNSSAYSMSKFAVRAFANALWSELRPEGVAVTLISPGFVESEIRNIDNQGKLRTESDHSLPAWLVASSEAAAREIVRATAKRKREQVVTFHGKVLVFLAQRFPCLVHLVSRLGAKGRSEPA